MEPQNEVDKYTMAVVDKENNIIGHLPKGKSVKYTSSFKMIKILKKLIYKLL